MTRPTGAVQRGQGGLATAPYPPAIDAFFTADRRGDVDALVGAFTGDAVLIQGGRDWTGPEEIRRWWEEASTYFHITRIWGVTELPSSAYLVRTRCSGTLPGGRTDVGFTFHLRSSAIRLLHIA